MKINRNLIFVVALNCLVYICVEHFNLQQIILLIIYQLLLLFAATLVIPATNLLPKNIVKIVLFICTIKLLDTCNKEFLGKLDISDTVANIGRIFTGLLLVVLMYLAERRNKKNFTRVSIANWNCNSSWLWQIR